MFGLVKWEDEGSVSVVAFRRVEFGFGGEVGGVVTVRYGGKEFHGLLLGKSLGQMLHNKWSIRA